MNTEGSSRLRLGLGARNSDVGVRNSCSRISKCNSAETILVTGGASGLGGATVDMVVAQGGRAMVIDLNEDGGRAKEAAHRGAVRFVKGDVTAEADVQRAIDVALADLGGVHGLVNVAGIPAAERVLPKEGVQPLPHFERVIRVNLIGTFNAIRLAAAAMASNAASHRR